MLEVFSEDEVKKWTDTQLVDAHRQCLVIARKAQDLFNEMEGAPPVSCSSIVERQLSNAEVIAAEMIERDIIQGDQWVRRLRREEE